MTGVVSITNLNPYGPTYSPLLGTTTVVKSRGSVPLVVSQGLRLVGNQMKGHQRVPGMNRQIHQYIDITAYIYRHDNLYYSIIHIQNHAVHMYT